MSSDDELGELYGDSPGVRQPNGRTAKSNQKPVAGPSHTRTTSKGAANGKRKAVREESEVAETHVPEVTDDHIEVSDTEASVQVVDNKGKGRAAPTKMSGHTAVTAKGKGKGPPPRKTAKKTPARRASPDDDQMALIDDAVAEPPNKRPRASDADKAIQQLSRLQKQLNDVIAERDALRKQLEDVHKVRNTDAEELAEQQRANYEARLKTQEQLIQELTSSLARVEPLARSGHTSSLHFLTREAVEEEKRNLEQEVSRLKETVKKREQELAESRHSLKESQIELKAEIERSKTLAQRGGPSAPNGRTKGAKQEFTPAQTRAVRFYEDLTNLLVTKHSLEPSPVPGLPDESCFTCIYTHGETHLAINFTLRLYSEPAEDSDELIEKVKYVPHDLDKESAEFREVLAFLNAPFIFERSQLHVFLNTVGETLKEKKQDADLENSGEVDNSGELVYPE
ncbi:hypothetical protein OE88DRAFT_1653157 [Heliocybe sulcata]|uniref:Monopolin complex subunit Csm1/Pcs1 C-terminal domain-containing protein n=1 Tax=Heliocybe sulcata TaxID=5364 RepID=A0A5C3NAJ5_9AGAM|nr:hypothetical protein OE88DRAFT_1653157 [Heliocybe sulcata]